MSRLTTHVLDTSHGCPAAGMTFRLEDIDRQVVLLTGRTNIDGRTLEPLLEGDKFRKGCYSLSFGVADYFRSRQVVLPDVPFLDVVSIRFGIADILSHYHVPLLVSPYGYSTYRGS